MVFMDVLASIMTCEEGWNLSPCQHLIIYSDRYTITKVYVYRNNTVYPVIYTILINMRDLNTKYKRFAEQELVKLLPFSQWYYDVLKKEIVLLTCFLIYPSYFIVQILPLRMQKAMQTVQIFPTKFNIFCLRSRSTGKEFFQHDHSNLLLVALFFFFSFEYLF